MLPDELNSEESAKRACRGRSIGNTSCTVLLRVISYSFPIEAPGEAYATVYRGCTENQMTLAPSSLE